MVWPVKNLTNMILRVGPYELHIWYDHTSMVQILI